MGCVGSKDEGSYFQTNKILSGKNALITGGNRGLGKQIVLIFAEAGANIVFNSSSPNKEAEEFAQEVSRKYGILCYYTPCNIRNEKEIDRMVKFAQEKLERIDILINNAGKTCFGRVEDLTLDAYEECMEINLTAPFLFCQKIVPMMKKNKWGRIINFTSGTTTVIQPNLFAYIAAKNGVNSVTKVLAKEVGDYNITVNTLLPGPMDTDMFNNGISGFASSLGYDVNVVKKQVLSEQVIKEPVQPKSLAEVTLFLCSQSGAPLTGGIYAVDNGFTC